MDARSVLPILEGFPAKFGPIIIENGAWIQGRSIILPGVKIGKGAIVGMGAIVTKSIASNSFVTGIPAKRQSLSTRRITDEQLECIIKELCKEYRRLASAKNLDIRLHLLTLGKVSIEDHSGRLAVFDLLKRSFTGDSGEAMEDFRDFLRRRGIRIFTEEPFKSIIPEKFKRFEEIYSRW